jgi:hypothetical protein
MAVQLQEKFKIPAIQNYIGVEDVTSHIAIVTSHIAWE